MMNRTTLSLLLALIGAAGCTETARLISFKDPAYRTKHFRKVLILADSADATWRSRVEENLASCMTDLGMRVLTSVDVIPPTRIWGTAERQDSILAAGVDAMLECTVEERGIDTWYRPPQTVTTTKVTSEEHGKKGDSIRNRILTSTTSTSTTGGDTVRSAWSKLSVKLIDVGNGKLAWMSSYRIYDNVDSRVSFANLLAATLEADDIVARR